MSFLFSTALVAVGAYLALQVRALLGWRETADDRINQLDRELSAVRMAFHRRVSELETQVAAMRTPGAIVTEATQPSPEAEAPSVVEPAAPAPEPAVSEPPPPEPTPEPEPFQPPPPPVVELSPPAPPEEPLLGRVNWEQWIGVRGAALLGGIVLALAAALFLQYSIEKGLIPPIVRVAVGMLTGVGAIGASEALRKRGYDATANALAGAGAVILYASTWAARSLYDLIGAGLAYALMTLTTVSCGLLAWRHAAREIAILGLAGGFATPLLLSTGSDSPIGLFSYVLMLDAGLMVLARKRRWPLLLLLGLGGTLFYQAAWILDRMGPDRYWLGLAILAVFAAFFVIASRWRGEIPDEDRTVWRRTQFASILLPFAFALYFAGNAQLGPHLYPTALLIGILSAAACWLGREEEFRSLPAGTAGGALGVVLIWMVSTSFTTSLAWEAFAICVGLAAVFHVFTELGKRTPERLPSIATPTLAVSLGFLLLTAAIPLTHSNPSVWPWMAAWAALAAVLVRQARITGQGLTEIAAASGLGLGFAAFWIVHGRTTAFPTPAVYVTLAAVAAAAFQLLALRRGDGKTRWASNAASATIALILLAAHAPMAEVQALPGWLLLSSTLVFALLAIQSATRLPSGWLYLGTLTLASFSHLVWTASHRVDERAALGAMAIQIAGVVLFTFWPFLAGRRLLAERGAIYGAALAGPAWFLSLRQLYETALGEQTIGVLPVLLGALSLAAVLLARRSGATGPNAMRPLVWFSAVALSFLALAIPLQLDREWITIGWAVQGFAILLLWKRLDHPGLKYFALALFAAVSVRLLVNPEVLVYHGRSGTPVLSWLTYTYLVPAGALLLGAGLLEKVELSRVRPREQGWYQSGRPIGAILCGLSAVLVVFAWINLTIFDFYSQGLAIELSFERMAARDLTLSLAWAVYALILLGIGMKRDSGGLRWVSLGFLMLTIGKVFLHDLGELEDLYRVGSLVGLAVSLILVSLAYQRFVFRKVPSEEQS